MHVARKSVEIFRRFDEFGCADDESNRPADSYFQHVFARL